MTRYASPSKFCSAMSDLLTKEQRRHLMQSVRRENTAPEAELAKTLKVMGIKFQQNVDKLPGKPDFYFPSARTVLFVHGCFWHGHAGCNKGKTPPKSNTEYWRKKVERNKVRDRRVVRKLRHTGLSVFTIWACQIDKHQLPRRFMERIEIGCCSRKAKKVGVTSESHEKALRAPKAI